MITGITMNLSGSLRSTCTGGRLIGRSFTQIPRALPQERGREFFAAFFHSNSNRFRGSRTLNGVTRKIRGQWEAPGLVRIARYDISITDRNGTCTIVVLNHVIRQDETEPPCLKSRFRIAGRCWNAEVGDRDGTVRFFRLPSGNRIGMAVAVRGSFPVTCSSPGSTPVPLTSIGSAIVDPLPAFYVLLRPVAQTGSQPRPGFDAEQRDPQTGEVVRAVSGYLIPPGQVFVSMSTVTFASLSSGLCAATARSVTIGQPVRELPQ